MRGVWRQSLGDGDWGSLDPTATIRPMPELVQDAATETLVADAQTPSQATTLRDAGFASTTDADMTRPTVDLAHSTDAGRPVPSRHYIETAPIGRGGMGEVVRADQRSLARPVALKRVLSGKDGERRRAAFISEALVTGYLDHPNIVPVHELGMDAEGRPFMAMKLVGGEPWSALLGPNGGMDELPRHLDILQAVCNAVAFAHDRGFIHRDLKPDNIMVGAFGEVLVMDWGIAVAISDSEAHRARAPHRNEIVHAGGTPCFLAPEMAEGRGRDFGPWTDVYLLGGMLHQILTGRPPHRGKGIMELLQLASRSAEPEFPDDVPHGLAEICRRCLRRAPSERFPDAESLGHALQAYRGHAESERLASAGQRGFDQARQSRVDNPETTYAAYAEAVAAFGQAIELWSDNHAAIASREVAWQDYAEVALERGDLELARSQLDQLPADHAGRRRIGPLIDIAATSRVRQQRQAKTFRRALLVAIGIIVIGLVIGIVVVNSARDEAVQQRFIAEQASTTVASQRDQLAAALAGAEESRVVAESALTRERDQRQATELARWDVQVESARRLYDQGLVALQEHDQALAAELFIQALRLAHQQQVPDRIRQQEGDPEWADWALRALSFGFQNNSESRWIDLTDELPVGRFGGNGTLYSLQTRDERHVDIIERDSTGRVVQRRSLPDVAGLPAAVRGGWTEFGDLPSMALGGWTFDPASGITHLIADRHQLMRDGTTPLVGFTIDVVNGTVDRWQTDGWWPKVADRSGTAAFPWFREGEALMMRAPHPETGRHALYRFSSQSTTWLTPASATIERINPRTRRAEEYLMGSMGFPISGIWLTDQGFMSLTWGNNGQHWEDTLPGGITFNHVQDQRLMLNVGLSAEGTWWRADVLQFGAYAQHRDLVTTLYTLRMSEEETGVPTRRYRQHLRYSVPLMTLQGPAHQPQLAMVTPNGLRRIDVQSPSRGSLQAWPTAAGFDAKAISFLPGSESVLVVGRPSGWRESYEMTMVLMTVAQEERLGVGAFRGDLPLYLQMTDDSAVAVPLPSSVPQSRRIKDWQRSGRMKHCWSVLTVARLAGNWYAVVKPYQLGSDRMGQSERGAVGDAHLARITADSLELISVIDWPTDTGEEPEGELSMLVPDPSGGRLFIIFRGKQNEPSLAIPISPNGTTGSIEIGPVGMPALGKCYYDSGDASLAWAYRGQVEGGPTHWMPVVWRLGKGVFNPTVDTDQLQWYVNVMPGHVIGMKDIEYVYEKPRRREITLTFLATEVGQAGSQTQVRFNVDLRTEGTPHSWPVIAAATEQRVAFIIQNKVYVVDRANGDVLRSVLLPMTPTASYRAGHVGVVWLRSASGMHLYDIETWQEIRAPITIDRRDAITWVADGLAGGYAVSRRNNAIMPAGEYGRHWIGIHSVDVLPLYPERMPADGPDWEQWLDQIQESLIATSE